MRFQLHIDAINAIANVATKALPNITVVTMCGEVVCGFTSDEEWAECQVADGITSKTFFMLAAAMGFVKLDGQFATDAEVEAQFDNENVVVCDTDSI